MCIQSLPRLCLLIVISAQVAMAAQKPEATVLLPLDGTEQIAKTFGRAGVERFLKTASGEANTLDHNGSLHLGATTPTAEGNKYVGVMILLPEPIDLRDKRLMFHARTNQPGVTAALYVRVYNRGQGKPAWSFHSWNGLLGGDWREFRLQAGLSLDGLAWEPNVVEDRVATAVDRIEFIIGSGENNAPIDILLDSVHVGDKLDTLADLKAFHPHNTSTELVRDGRSLVTILHPDSEAGRQAATTVAKAVVRHSDATPETRVATAADRVPDRPTIMLGNVHNNPAMLLLYARYFTPADSVCPGDGGSLVHTVCDPFGAGSNVIVAAASNDIGLEHAAEVLASAIDTRPKSSSLVVPRLFEPHYGPSFLKRFGWADDDPAPDRLQQGLRQGQESLDRGKHTSIAGELRTVANRYMFNGHAVEARLFVELWDLYATSAKADPRKFGGPWGFDSDFPSAQVVAGWDVIEEDPTLTDEQRLRTTKNMGRWLSEAVLPSCIGAASSTRVPHNHQTFPGLGALFAGLYLSQHYDVLEGEIWLGIADAMFTRQAEYFKPHEDCNGYQWLTNGHLMRYSMARPDFTLFENGNGSRIIDYCIGTMDNLGYQVPYGDTGSWQCWNSEMICLDMFAHATGSAEARWAANHKRSLKNTLETHAFYQLPPGERPDRFNGVRVWPVEPQYYESHGADERPPLERCFDKIAFRESMEPAAAYLLLDGLSNGGHKHLDGNSLPRLTLFERIWLADNDYYKAPVKFHNSVTVFRDGQSEAIPDYVELVGAGESQQFGYSKTKLTAYAGVDWIRTVVWLKRLEAFAVLDQLTARSDNEYQFRAIWHGVGAATLDEDGLLLTQKGPSLRIQIAPGPALELRNDAELGANWSGYAHADPVVRSLEAVATVELAAGESYLMASVLHGKADGVAEPWGVDFVEGSDGVRLSTPDGDLRLMLDAEELDTPQGRLESDAECIVVSEAGLSLLGATGGRFQDKELFHSPQADDIDLNLPEVAAALGDIETRGPIPNVTAAFDAPPHQVDWLFEDVATPLQVTRLAHAALGGSGDADTILVATTGGTLLALNSDGSVRWVKEMGCRLNDITADDLTGDGKDEIILAREDYNVQVLDSSGEELWRRDLPYYRKPPTVNVIRTGDLDGDGTPEVIAGGNNWRFHAFSADGTELWHYESVHPSRSGAVADLDGDGKDEVICGTHYYWASVLNADGTSRWQYRFGPICHDIATGRFDGDGTRGVVFGGGDGKVHYVNAKGELKMAYATGDEVKHVAAGDLDGDGLDEILAGSLNYNLYCFDADARRWWRLDLGGEITSLVIAPRKEGSLVIVGTGKGRLASVDAVGAIRSVTQLDSEILDLLVTDDGVIVATADGRLRGISTTRD